MSIKPRILSTLTLFASFSTLVCCALPALFVSLGAGAALVGLLNAVPQLVWVSQHKVAVFAVAAILLAASGVARYLNRNAPCPIEPEQAETCKRLRRASNIMFYFSIMVYAIGFFFAFVASHVIGQ